MKYKNYNVLVIEKKLFSELNLNDDFFMSLRNDYNYENSNFDNWFIKKQKSGDSAFVYIDNSSKMVEGFLYLKIETDDEIYENIVPNFNSANRLKIGTFKVALTGRIMGERFIKIIFDHAKLNNVEEIYVTIFNDTAEKNALIKLRLLQYYNI